MDILAERIKLLRKEHKLKQTEVAKALDLSISAYCRYEYGEREPLARTIADMAKFYQVTSDYLLGLSDSKTF